LSFIEREFPAMKPRFERLYEKKYPPDGYRKEVKAMVRVLQERYGLTKREDAGETNDAGEGLAPTIDPEQVGFAW
jgi:hypothetical protein